MQGSAETTAIGLESGRVAAETSQPQQAPPEDPGITGEEGVTEIARDADLGCEGCEKLLRENLGSLRLQRTPGHGSRAGERRGNPREELDHDDEASEEKACGRGLGMAAQSEEEQRDSA
ncbi:hypothetical protein NDU88_006253 [Pleurodeles waltl]|uniref:Uncharacterized protein n=1 Tax=Pleurodeles waltl TaxID=8319 RepID=A0AAV7SP95_PLEWA|nr:hypothetical protein NDU88_006253 [Pleurodeles waltl]